MGTRKKSAELVFNLQWRNKPDNGGERSNIIGMYDTPTTTSNFEMFKSYLLKNSGVAGNDVKVTYLTDNGQEWVIDSQEWFEIALSAFRLKARLGEVIFLKLDKTSNMKKAMARKDSNDVETQFDVDSMGASAVSTPEWFVTYMKQFKQDIVEEVTFAVTSTLTANKDKENAPSVPPIQVMKKAKVESAKRSRRHGENAIDKELIKTLKFDRKLENKLDKLDAKTKKIKEKKQLLLTKISCTEDNHGGKRCHISLEPDVPSLMNASLVDETNTRNFQRMMGGEVYLHTWQVINSGKLPWTKNTELRLTWGSLNMVPSNKTIRCPLLQPGEEGSISVCFEIPKKPGTYESYWNFYDKNVRFGKSLSCCVVVEEPLSPIITGESVKMEEDIKPFGQTQMGDSGVEDTPKSPNISQTSSSNVFEGKMVHGSINTEGVPSFDVKVPEGAQEVIIFPSVGSGPVVVPFPKGTEKLHFHYSSTGDLAVTSTKEEALESNNESTHLLLPAKTGYIPSDVTNKHEAMLDEKQPFLFTSSPRKGNCTTLNVSEVKEENSTVTNENPVEMLKESTEELSSSVMDLSRRIQHLKFSGTPQPDSDSDWESVWSCGKAKNIEDATAECVNTNPNIYGIQEKDLIVDLSKNEEKNVKKENDDKNNNNSSESISEVGSEASSDLSSGYDIVNAPTCEEKDEGSGYVYITFDGNKLPVPKHIIRPDFLEFAEEAPGPLNSEDEEKPDNVEPSVPEQQTASVKVKDQSPNAKDTQETSTPDSKFMSHCSAAGSCFSDVAQQRRLFIFPQSNPGYEVVYPTLSEPEKTVHSTTSGEASSNEPTYTWAKFPSPCAYVKVDPYRPLNQPQSATCQTSSTHAYFPPHVPPHYPPYSEPHSVYQDQTFQRQRLMANILATTQQQQQYMAARMNRQSPNQKTSDQQKIPFAYVPQYTPNRSGYSSLVNQEQLQRHRLVKQFIAMNRQRSNQTTGDQQETPSAPPQPQPKTPELPQSPQVQILPENLVSGAVNVASSAINTARSVINMIVPKSEPGKWVNGHWVTENSESLRAKNLAILVDMGFWDMDLNATLLARYNDDIARVISELVQ